MPAQNKKTLFDILNFTEKSVTLQHKSKKTEIMARPIKPTPILYGEDAIRFELKMQNVKPISPEKRKEQREAYEWAKAHATFPML
jgi:hypothetical protein